jgi:hypothetical protein
VHAAPNPYHRAHTTFDLEHYPFPLSIFDTLGSARGFGQNIFLEPIFHGIMISSNRPQGISFLTEGVSISEKTLKE